MILLQENSPILKTPSAQVTDFAAVPHLTEEMFSIAAANHGVGLAAPQVGILLRVFIVCTPKLKKVFANPNVTPATGAKLVQGSEGCLSKPGYSALKRRWSKVVVSAQDEHGKPFTVKLEGLEAIVAQHEHDHLSGKLIF